MSRECEELLRAAACLVLVGVSGGGLSDQSTQGKGRGLCAQEPRLRPASYRGTSVYDTQTRLPTFL